MWQFIYCLNYFFLYIFDLILNDGIFLKLTLTSSLKFHFAFKKY